MRISELEDLFARATPPRHVNEDQDDGSGHHDDEGGHVHKADHGPGAWSDIWRLHEAEQAIRARYERPIQPYLATLKRNPGVRPAGLVALERERDHEIAEMNRAHDHAAQVSRAHRNKAKRINEAHDRQREGDALRPLGNDLPGGPRRYEAPQQYTGRATQDLWHW
jgi:hypothetical protein